MEKNIEAMNGEITALKSGLEESEQESEASNERHQAQKVDATT